MIDWDKPLRLAHKASFLMSMQEQTGVAFDADKARELEVFIRAELKKIKEEVEPQLPRRGLNKGEQDDYSFPAKCWKLDGSFSATFERFAAKRNLKIIDSHHVEFEGQVVEITSHGVLPKDVPISLEERSTALKDWLISKGWVPTLFNTKKDERGFKVNTSPKFAERGKLCENLEALEGDLVKKIIRYLSYSNRLGVLAGKKEDSETGWLNNERLAYDGRLPAGASGITNTQRVKHTIVCNVPKAKDDVLLGKEFRGLFIASPGKVLVGWDASQLEDRLKAHFTHRYDGGKYAAKILDPEYDVHQENADLWGMERHNAKHGTFCLAYNGGIHTLAKTLKCSEAQAEKYHAAYWRANKPIKDLEQALERWWETHGEKKYIEGLDGRKVFIRKKTALVNTLIQSSGSIVMDYAGAYVDAKLGGIKFDKDWKPCYYYKQHEARRVIFYHDEYVFECDPAIADEIAELGTKSIRAAGEYFKLKVPLESTAKIADSWAGLK